MEAPEEILKIKIKDYKFYNFSTRCINCFYYENIIYIEDLIELSEEILLEIPNFGTQSLKEVKEFLSTLDLKLSNSIDAKIKRNSKEIIGLMACMSMLDRKNIITKLVELYS